MSRTTIWNVYKTKATPRLELPNSWWTAPPLWDYLCETYLDGKKWIHGDVPELWEIWKNKTVPDFLRCALLMTFDKAIVEIADLGQAAQYCGNTNSFLSERVDYGLHWQSIADELVKAHHKHDKRCLGIGLGCTSVSDPWWNYKKGVELFSVIAAVNEIGDKASK